MFDFILRIVIKRSHFGFSFTVVDLRYFLIAIDKVHLQSCKFFRIANKVSFYSVRMCTLGSFKTYIIFVHHLKTKIYTLDIEMFCNIYFRILR